MGSFLHCIDQWSSAEQLQFQKWPEMFSSLPHECAYSYKQRVKESIFRILNQWPCTLAMNKKHNDALLILQRFLNDPTEATDGNRSLHSLTVFEELPVKL